MADLLATTFNNNKNFNGLEPADTMCELDYIPLFRGDLDGLGVTT